MQHFDIVIVGGGLVGTSLAIALQDTGLKIALIDERKPSLDDPRLFALNISCCEFLSHLDVWQALQPHATPIKDVHVSKQGRFGAVRLRGQDLKLSALGYVIPAYYVEQALHERLQQLSHCKLYRPAHLHTIVQNSESAELSFSLDGNDVSLSAAVVIGADGTNSTVRSQLALNVSTHDYQQSALVTRVVSTHHHAYRAYERFIDTGAVALLPLKDNECALILTLPTDKVLELQQAEDETFLAYLQTQFGSRLGQFTACKKRYIFPLKMVKAESAFKDHVYLLGNAAQTLHPIAAQGFNLALYEVATLVEMIQNKIQQQVKFDKADLFLLWEKTKKQKTTSVEVSHQLSQLFTQNNFLANMATQAGMISLSMLPPVKKYLLKRLLGRSGQVPKLLLGKHA